MPTTCRTRRPSPSSPSPAPATPRRRHPGACYHRYTIDASGRIRDAKIVSTAAVNQATIERGGNDGVGPAVVSRLRGLLPAGGSPVARANAADLMAAWDGRDAAIVVDATRSGADPGTVRRFAAEGQALLGAAAGDPSSHALGVAQASSRRGSWAACPTASRCSA